MNIELIKNMQKDKWLDVGAIINYTPSFCALFPIHTSEQGTHLRRGN